jgi:hypothetical protein
MQVSNSTNNYQALNVYQQQAQRSDAPTIQPIELPDYTNKEIYEASNGNIIRGDDGSLTLTPQGETKVQNSVDDAKEQLSAEAQAQKDATRGVVVDYLEASSKKSQVEIYLAVATDGSYDTDNETADVISELRDVQKQNNAVQAYATYQEAQNSGITALF